MIIAIASGGGGGWGSSGGAARSDTTISVLPAPVPGEAGGKAVHLNGYSVTWAATGTRYGAIS